MFVKNSFSTFTGDASFFTHAEEGLYCTLKECFVNKKYHTISSEVNSYLVGREIHRFYDTQNSTTMLAKNSDLNLSWSSWIHSSFSKILLVYWPPTYA
jgi:hypothetical protein